MLSINDNRGKIIHIARKQQILDFSGVRYENITPTDIDAVIEYKNRAYIFIEVKYLDAKLPYGQMLAIERLVNDTSLKKHSFAIIAKHEIHDVDEHVKLSDCVVRQIYYKRQWHDYLKYERDVKSVIDGFICKVVTT
jgi:hypothetical protein